MNKDAEDKGGEAPENCAAGQNVTDDRVCHIIHVRFFRIPACLLSAFAVEEKMKGKCSECRPILECNRNIVAAVYT